MATVYSNDFTSYTVGQDLEAINVVNDFGQGGEPTTDVQLNGSWGSIKACRLTGGNLWGNCIFIEPSQYTGDFELTARCGTSHRIGISFRAQNAGSTFIQNGYFYQLIPNQANESKIYRSVNQSLSQVSTNTTTGVSASDMQVKIRMEGGRIRIWVDDTLYHDYTDGSPLTTYGYYGMTQFNSNYYLTDLLVDDLVIPPAPPSFTKSAFGGFIITSPIE